MKIGILTFHRPINYGAFLQAYGLSEYLKKVLPTIDVEVIDYFAPKERKKIYINILSRLKRNGIQGFLTEVKKIGVFRKSINQLTLSKRKFCTGNLKKLYSFIDLNYDVLVIGSDAVFNWNQNGYPTAFIPKYDFSIPILTYAVSAHGLKFYEEPETRIKECGQTFDNVEEIYVRDECTKAFVEYCNPQKKGKHACDPTFLIDFECLYKIQHRSTKELFAKYRIRDKYIVFMLQDEEISKKLYQKYKDKYKIVSLFLSNKYADCFMYDLSPVEWCLVLKNAEVVITSYFHGALLSLLQSTPTMVVDVSRYEGLYEGKLDDLMCRRLLLKPLYYKAGDWKNNEEKFFKTIDCCLTGDYDKAILDGINKERQTYISFLSSLKDIIGELNGQV